MIILIEHHAANIRFYEFLSTESPMLNLNKRLNYLNIVV